MLKFNAKDHIYTLNDVVIPSVTQILNEYIPFSYGDYDYYINPYTRTVLSADVLNNASFVGTEIHKIFEVILSGQNLDFGTLNENLFGPALQIQNFMEDFDVKTIAVEKRVYSEKYKVAGTFDLLCTLGKSDKLVLIDLKTYAKPLLVGPQISAYVKLYKEMENYKGSIDRAFLYVPKDGGQYKLNYLHNTQDFDFFLCKLSEFNYLKTL